MNTENRIRRACEIALQFGMIDGAHHKMWVIDQMLRILLDEKYIEKIKKYNDDEHYSDWDEGIEP